MLRLMRPTATVTVVDGDGASILLIAVWRDLFVAAGKKP